MAMSVSVILLQCEDAVTCRTKSLKFCRVFEFSVGMFAQLTGCGERRLGNL